MINCEIVELEIESVQPAQQGLWQTQGKPVSQGLKLKYTGWQGREYSMFHSLEEVFEEAAVRPWPS